MNSYGLDHENEMGNYDFEIKTSYSESINECTFYKKMSKQNIVYSCVGADKKITRKGSFRMKESKNKEC